EPAARRQTRPDEAPDQAAADDEVHVEAIEEVALESQTEAVDEAEAAAQEIRVPEAQPLEEQLAETVSAEPPLEEEMALTDETQLHLSVESAGLDEPLEPIEEDVDVPEAFAALHTTEEVEQPAAPDWLTEIETDLVEEPRVMLTTEVSPTQPEAVAVAAPEETSSD